MKTQDPRQTPDVADADAAPPKEGKRPWSTPTVKVRDGLLRVDTGTVGQTLSYDTSQYFPQS